MSNTDFLRKAEAELLPPGFEHGHIFSFESNGEIYTVEVDGWNKQTREAVEICQSEAGDSSSPKPGQRRKLASDVLKLTFLKQLELITRGRVVLTSEEMYTWFHRTRSWLSAAAKYYGIDVELKHLDKKTTRKRVRNVMRDARKVFKP